MIIVVITTDAGSCSDSVGYAMAKTLDVIRARQMQQEALDRDIAAALAERPHERTEPDSPRWLAPRDHRWLNRWIDRPPLKASGYG